MRLYIISLKQKYVNPQTTNHDYSPFISGLFVTGKLLLMGMKWVKHEQLQMFSHKLKKYMSNFHPLEVQVGEKLNKITLQVKKMIMASSLTPSSPSHPALHHIISQ